MRQVFEIGPACAPHGGALEGVISEVANRHRLLAIINRIEIIVLDIIRLYPVRQQQGLGKAEILFLK